MLSFVFLSADFYNRYSDCPEILKKESRPYIQAQIEIDGVLFAIPLRSNINHPHVLWTEKENRSGLDFSKTVVIEDLNFIEARKPYIRKREFDSLRGKEYIVRAKLLKYISDYRRAKAETNIPRNALLCKCSALQYFDKYLERQAGDCP